MEGERPRKRRPSPVFWLCLLLAHLPPPRLDTCRLGCKGRDASAAMAGGFSWPRRRWGPAFCRLFRVPRQGRGDLRFSRPFASLWSRPLAGEYP